MLPRPSPLRALLALLPALLAACGGAPAPPNLVLVTIDTLRADHTSLHGYDRPTTPALEALARRGTTFESASSTSSWTLPSMHTILTGEFRVERGGRMHFDQRTLAEALSRRGYRTCGISANALLDEGQGFHRGYDRYEVVPPPDPRKGTRPEWTGEEVVDKGLEWLGAEAGPFFLHLHLFDPHGPYEPTRGAEFAARSSPERLAAFRAATPEHARDALTPEVYARIEDQIARYDAEVLQADRALARLLAHLDERGLSETTLVVVTSDHGEGLWQRARLAEEKAPPGMLFGALYVGHGAMLHSEQVHVPLVLAGPGVPHGVRRREPVSLVDLLPTILARLGVPAPPRADGADLLAPGAPAAEPLFTVCTRGTAVTVDGRWRLHAPAEYRVARHGATPELFDLERDPGELHPLDEPERTARCLELVAAWRDRHRRGDEDRIGTTSRAHIEALRALGYAGEADAAEAEAGVDAAPVGDGAEKVEDRGASGPGDG